MSARFQNSTAAPNARLDENTRASFISPDEFEEAMVSLIPPTLDDRPAAIKPFKDSVFLQITQLLERFGKRAWSLRPRTYAILRMINRVDTMNTFVAEGLYDISLPYSQKTLPDTLKDPTIRLKFLEVQSLVLTIQATDIESGDGQHRHFAQDADIHFELIKQLGKGGFGKVDHVRSRLSRNDFARKRISRGRKFRDKAALLGFEQELEILKRLSHRHLVKYIGSYTDPRHVGLIMSPVADSNLAQFLELSPLPTEQLIYLRRFYGCLSSALGYLHENRIRHKDIKPFNILVHGDNALITDFGTSLDWRDRGHSTTSDEPTSPLTLAYCSPEVVHWEPRNCLSDIYSLGCVFLEMTTVLRGQSLKIMKEYFHSHGTKESYVRTNREAMHLWLDKLRDRPNPACDNEPLEWIKDMVKVRREDRPSALELANRIRECEGDFVGTCCVDGNESTESSYQGSVLDEKAALKSENTKGIDNAAELKDITAVLRRGRLGELAEQEQPQLPTRQLTYRQMSSRNPHSAAVLNSTTQEETPAQLLVKKGFDIEAKDFHIPMALFWAAVEGHETVVRLLLEKGADVDMKDECFGETALYWAASNGHDAVVQQLLEKGADIKAKGSSQQTALDRAASKGQTTVVRLLLEKLPEIIVREDDLGATALYWAARKGHEEVVRLLLKSGVDVEAKERESGGTALHQAASEGQAAVVQLLLANGASVDAKEDKIGETALHQAAWKGHGEVVRLLLENGANINAKEDKIGETALHRAAWKGHEEVVRLLLENGANINAKEMRFGETALHHAARKGHKAVVRLLLENGADVEIKDINARTAVDQADRNGQEAVAHLLQVYNST